MLIPRSEWTSIVPRPSTAGENTIGLPYFKFKPEVEFLTPQKPLLYAYRNPHKELEMILKENTHQTGISDIDYNYAIASNMAGVFVCRGKLTKCAHTDKLKVLMLIGSTEKPTDVLKKNKRDFLEMWNNGMEGNPLVTTPLRPGMNNVHVFSLIEWLAERRYYFTRNDGVYGPMLQRAVCEFQDDNNQEINGLWDEKLIHFVDYEGAEFIPLPVSDKPPVGATIDSMMGVDA